MTFYRFLLRFRRIFASAVLIGFGLLFLNILPDKIHILLKGFAEFQFTPALLTLGTASTVLVSLLLLTLLFGRVYCGFLCPLGILQDLVIHLKKRRIGKKLKYRYFRSAWYTAATLVFVIGLLVGLPLFTYLLDPYAVFGRSMNSIINPIVTGIWNLAVLILNHVGIYSLYPVTLPRVTVLSLVSATLLIGIPLTMAWFYGRRYCNLVCPVGGILRIISRISLFRIRVREDSCTHCGLCERVCRAEAIDSKTMTVNFDLCTHCYHCFGSCSTNALEFTAANRRADQAVKQEKDRGRRSFLMKIPVLLLAFTEFVKAQTKVIEVYVMNKIPVPREIPVVPPGALSLANFTENCIACQLCVAACPTRVLKPALHNSRTGSALQPEMDFITGFCNYNCTICSEVCPTPAIQPLSLQQKQEIQIGKSIFIKDNCVVYTQGTDCGACAEHCPTKAVSMKPDKDGKLAPFIDEKICVGCGQCEYACPTRPHKAIFVAGHSVHIAAERPPEDQTVPMAEPENYDFPF